MGLLGEAPTRAPDKKRAVHLMRYFFPSIRYFPVPYISGKSPRGRGRAASGRRFFAGALAAGALIVLAGCAAAPADPAAKASPSTDVGRMQAWRDARAVAAMGRGRMTVIGAGDSMLPVYGEGTVLVLSKIDFDALKPGMQVAYMNGGGRQVVHVLLSYDAAARGWRVRGLNNEAEDSALVTARNLIGVVYASFSPGEGMR